MINSPAEHNKVGNVVTFLRIALPIAAATVLSMPAASAETLEASDGAATVTFGQSADLDGANALIGACHANVDGKTWRGSAYYFKDIGFGAGTSTETAILAPSNGAAQDQFGHGVCIYGSNALVGAPMHDITCSDQGAAYYYANIADATETVTETLRLTYSGAADGDYLGYYNSLYGTSAVLTAPGAGFACYYKDIADYTTSSSNYDSDTDSYTQNLILTASDNVSGDDYGMSVALYDTNVVIGAMWADLTSGDTTYTNSGEAYYYNLASVNTDATSTTESVILSTSDGPSNYAMLGRSASLYEDNALVGAYGLTVDDCTYCGAVYYYKNLSANTTGSATEDVKLLASDGADWYYFGNSVSLSGDDALVGAFYAPVDDSPYIGKAYYFEGLDDDSDTVNETLAIAPSETDYEQLFGYSVNLDGDNFVITAESGENSVGVASGTAYTGTISSMTTLDVDGGATRVIAGLSFTSQTNWIVGGTYSNNSVTLSSGDSADVTASGANVCIGRYAGSDDNSLTIDGSLTATHIYLGMDDINSGNVLTIGSCGLLKIEKIDIGVPADDDNMNELHVCYHGLLAVQGDVTSSRAEVLALGYFFIGYGDEYVLATTDNFDGAYCTNEDEVAAFLEAEGMEDCGYAAADLVGCSLFTGNLTYSNWADNVYGENGWYYSSWYGWFYNSNSWGGWIWSAIHHWQYVYDAGDGDVYIYDKERSGWWFTTKEFYPYVYDYKTDTWLCYLSGEAGSRYFWSYGSNSEIQE